LISISKFKGGLVRVDAGEFDVERSKMMKETTTPNLVIFIYSVAPLVWSAEAFHPLSVLVICTRNSQ
jgi:hypothetical protein